MICAQTDAHRHPQIPSFGPYFLGALCLIVAALQIWGFYVRTEAI
jgi:hypothetical protein